MLNNILGRNSLRQAVIYLSILPLLAACQPARGLDKKVNDKVLSANLTENISAEGRVTCEYAAVMADGARTGGGNEASLGDFYVNIAGNLEHSTNSHSLGFFVDYVPRGSVLDFNTSNSNSHNSNRLRADGFLNRPDLHSHVHLDKRLGDNKLSVSLGGKKFAGLETLDGSPTDYYAAQLSPLAISQHYDKGIQIAYSAPNRFNLDLGIIDGDWQMGEPSVFRHHDSRANSYPGFSFNIAWEPFSSKRFGALNLEGSALIDDIGSNGGQKTYNNNLIIAASYSAPGLWKDSLLKIRAFAGNFERGKTWGPNSERDWPAEMTNFFGLEGSIGNIPLGDAGSLAAYVGYARMNHESGEPAGTIWKSRNTSHEGQYQSGLRWKEPYGIKHLTLNFSAGKRSMNGLPDWHINDKKEQYIGFLGAEI